MIDALDEPVLRTPDWTPGAWIRLADGRDWALPPIPVEWRHRTLLDGTLDLQPRWPVELLRELLMLSHRPDLWAAYHRLARIGTLLLQSNYWLDSAQCAALLPFDPLRPEFVATLGAIGTGDTSAVAAAPWAALADLRHVHSPSRSDADCRGGQERTDLHVAFDPEHKLVLAVVPGARPAVSSGDDMRQAATASSGRRSRAVVTCTQGRSFIFTSWESQARVPRNRRERSTRSGPRRSC